MAAHYNVVQYVPDPVIDERINVGVIVYNETCLRAHFLKDWKRVQAFGDRDVSFLKEFAKQVMEATGSGEKPRFDAADVERMASKWINSIQLTQPRGSLLSLDDLFSEVGSRFLREPKTRPRRARDRRAAVKLARDELTAALRRRGFAQTEDRLSKAFTLEGKVESHSFEIGISNGRLRAAVDALSFEGSDDEGMNRDLKATAWSFGDVHTFRPDLKLSVVILVKNPMSSIFQRAANIFDKLDAQIVTEEGVAEWADRLVDLTAH